jgi:hypothetical protein
MTLFFFGDFQMSTVIFMLKRSCNEHRTLRPNLCYRVGQLFDNPDNGRQHEFTEEDAAQTVGGGAAIFVDRVMDHHNPKYFEGQRCQEIRQSEKAKLRAEYEKQVVADTARLDAEYRAKLDPSCATARIEQLQAALAAAFAKVK